MLNNLAKKKSFNYVIEAIDCYWQIQLQIPIKLVFILLNRLSLISGLPTNLNYIKSESYFMNCNISDEIGLKYLLQKKYH